MGAVGIVAINKPKGITSHDVVDRIRRLYSERRVGHAGTLDPSASGVLIVGVGKATRVLRYFQLLHKEYDALIGFGVGTSTLDAEGEVVETAAVSFRKEDLERALSNFVGEIFQTPPMFSAIKVGGEPLYKKARRGESQTLRPRRQFVYDIVMTSDPTPGPDGLVKAGIRLSCDSGTYVRSLAADLAKALGTVGHLVSLERIAIGPFRIEQSLSLEEIEAMSVDRRRAALVWGRRAVPHLPCATLQPAEAFGVRSGKPLPLDEAKRKEIQKSLKRACEEIPYLEQSFSRAGLLSRPSARAANDPSDGRGAGSEAPRSAVPDGCIYTGPVALSTDDGALIAIARPAGDILKFDCVLA